MVGRILQILEKINSGGMGDVFKARDIKLERTIAIKVLLQEVMAGPERRARFVREALAASAIDHPNIIAIYDIAESEGLHS